MIAGDFVIGLEPREAIDEVARIAGIDHRIVVPLDHHDRRGNLAGLAAADGAELPQLVDHRGGDPGLFPDHAAHLRIVEIDVRQGQLEPVAHPRIVVIELREEPELLSRCLATGRKTARRSLMRENGARRITRSAAWWAAIWIAAAPPIE